MENGSVEKTQKVLNFTGVGGSAEAAWKGFLPLWEQPLLCLSRASCRHSLFPGVPRVEFLAVPGALCPPAGHGATGALQDGARNSFLHNVCKAFINQSCSPVQREGKGQRFPGIFIWDGRAWAGLQGALRWDPEFISGVKHLRDARKRGAGCVEFCRGKGSVAPAFGVSDDLNPSSSAQVQFLPSQTLGWTWNTNKKYF